jgi:hypothetical protein
MGVGNCCCEMDRQSARPFTPFDKKKRFKITLSDDNDAQAENGEDFAHNDILNSTISQNLARVLWRAKLDHVPQF